MAKDYGDYQARKDQLLGKGRAWFKKLALGWQGEERISEAKLKDMGVQICDGRTSQEGLTFIRFTEEHKLSLLTAAEWRGFDPLIVKISQKATRESTP
jgi:hypothetical protein